MTPQSWRRVCILRLVLAAAPLGLLAVAPSAAAQPKAAVVDAGPLCGNGVVDPGEECDPCDPNVPVEGTDRYNLCNCNCKLRGREMPLTLKMGAFYLVGGLALYGLRGSFKRLRGPGAGAAALRMVVALLLGVVLLVWGCLEWAAVVAPPMQSSSGVLFSDARQGGNCADCAGKRRR